MWTCPGCKQKIFISDTFAPPEHGGVIPYHDKAPFIRVICPTSQCALWYDRDGGEHINGMGVIIDDEEGGTL